MQLHSRAAVYAVLALVAAGAAFLPPAAAQAPQVFTAQASSNGSAQGVPVNSTLASVNQTVPSFYAIRSCIPYNVVVQPEPFQRADSAGNAGSSGNTTNSTARIEITADYQVINATQASVVGGVLALSLLQGFETHQPIQFTIHTSNSRQLRYVGNFGSGHVIVRPGLNVSTFEVETDGVGQVLAYGVAADSLLIRSNGISGSIVRGNFSSVEVSSSGTGTLVITSATPTQVAADISGITTLLLDVPAGSTINGSAGGLAKVQYTGGTCNIQSPNQLPFPVPSIFGRRGGFGVLGGPTSVFGLGSKCEQVDASGVSSYTTGTPPQWSCGMVADGRSSCNSAPAGGTSGVVTWSITNLTSQPMVPGNSSVPLVNVVLDAISRAYSASPLVLGPNNSSSSSPPMPGADATAASTSPSPSPAPESAPGATTTTTPQGTITTSSFTSGPGSSAVGSGSVGNATGGTTQTTISSNGGAPLTTLLPGGVGDGVWNPLFVPPLAALPSLTEPSPAPAGQAAATSAGPTNTDNQNSSGTAAGPTTAGAQTVRFATNVPQPSSVQVVAVSGPGGNQVSESSDGGSSFGSVSSSSGGNRNGIAGIAVASTTCAANPQQLLVPGLT